MATILVVDDNNDFAELTQAILTKAGYHVLSANTATKSILTAKKDKPDLILMDVMLPGMNGAEIVKTLKDDAHLKHIPVIFLTGLLCLREHEIIVDGHRYRALAKPFETNNLLKEVKEVLGGKA
jgi:two-component system alkaline phosphatase synthesis response regulator PhoP